MLVQRSGEWLSAALGDECALMNIETGNYVTLSRVGTRIWELIEAPVTVKTLCARLIEEYEVPVEVCATEVDVFLKDLVKCQAVTLSPQP